MMAAHFPDPIHIGAVPSLVFALVSDAICSVLVMLGLATRWAALIVVINIGVAWSLVHHFIFFARPQGDHGELCFLYISVFLALFVAGAGRYSLDALIAKGTELSAPITHATDVPVPILQLRRLRSGRIDGWTLMSVGLLID